VGISVIGFKALSFLIKLLKPSTFPFNRAIRKNAN
jgi:hypothetical protein